MGANKNDRRKEHPTERVIKKKEER